VRISAGRAISYATMPGIFPRLKDLVFSGFGPVTQLVAIICFMAGLLPKNHPCFSKDKKSQYGLIRILAAAADGVEFKWKNIDKIVIFAMILCGAVMMFLYLAGIVFYFITTPSFASAFAAMVQTTSPTNDVAFMMLDKVLGIPGIYNSSVSTAAGFPSPFHLALHEIFRFYSMAIFFIAFVIFFYHVVHLVLDITQTGKVSEHMSDDIGDGSRGFSWLPIRFVMCFGLLLPFGDGFNSAQWITLYAAKYGSGLATNTWLNYNSAMGDNPTSEQNKRLVARPPVLDNTGLIKSLFLMRSCMEINTRMGGNGGALVEGYVINGSKNYAVLDRGAGYPGFLVSRAYNASPPKIAAGDATDDFIRILQYSDLSDIRIVLGNYDPANPDRYREYPGKVLPICGEVVIPVTGRTGEAMFASEGYLFSVLNVLFDINRPGSSTTPEEDALDQGLIREFVRTSSLYKAWTDSLPAVAKAAVLTAYCGDAGLLGDCDRPVKPSYWKYMMDEFYNFVFASAPYLSYDFLADTNTAKTFDTDEIYIFSTPTSYSVVGEPNPLMMTTAIKDRGWGGAGLWYNKIGERNGSLYTAVTNVPQVQKYPMVMEEIKDKRLKTDPQIGGDYCEKFNPRKSGTSSTYLSDEKNQFNVEQATSLYNFCSQLFSNGELNQDGITRGSTSSNAIEKAIGMFFSEFQIFDNKANREVTPMAQLTSVGRILIDKAILGVTASAASYAVGGAAHMSAGDDKKAQAMASGFGMIGKATMAIALMGLSSGFVLYYMLPIMPFIYFFFAVGRWVKVIFEALVGVPLWALAHMRVGGPGLPGSAAIGGYFLILEIFIRPILTIFSLVAAFSIFSALVVGLNTVFTLVSANLFGSAAPSATMGDVAIQLTRGMLDQFFLSIFFIYLTYTIGIGSFKLIDIIPDNIMRWSGSGVQSFAPSDNSDDMIDQWQFDLPVRFNSSTGTIGSALKAALYDPGAKITEGKNAEEKKKKLEEKKRAEALAQSAKNVGPE